MSNKNERRDFLKFAGLGVLASAVCGRALAEAAKAPGKVDPKDKMSIDLGYVEDASKVDTKKWSKRAGPEGAKQYCYNCMFYQPKGDAKKSKEAPCQIFSGKNVPAKAWCNSWTQSPTVKD